MEVLEFTVKHRDWNVGDEVKEFTNENIASFLAKVSNTVLDKFPQYLTEKIDIDGLLTLKPEGTVEERLKLLKSPGTSRKIGSYVIEDDKKLKKLLVDVAKAVLVRESLKDVLPIEFALGKIEEMKIRPRYEEDHINFTAKYGRWIVVKRLIIDEKTPLLDIARLLASINETAINKIPEFAGIEIKDIKEHFKEFKRVRKDEDIKRLVEKFNEFQPKNSFESRYAVSIMLSKLNLTIDPPAKNLEKYLEKAG
ncbi:DUF2666 family protein [Pyrococcus sp. ST04]|uniref:DUF2666 family protein n=1 Tax=Pyrococcus sp. ST04 TaxID=1183377 RepID=UPI000260593D|nr:DUF2666 family protein [Pyrococcus sp. ST04]AFK21742.1 hypothetical protein Py04_0137 [Pyrococcus sp. ST04]